MRDTELLRRVERPGTPKVLARASTALNANAFVPRVPGAAGARGVNPRQREFPGRNELGIRAANRNMLGNMSGWFQSWTEPAPEEAVEEEPE